MTKTAIPPGGEGEIEVTFSTGRKKGQQKKSITVTSNDPENPTTRISVTVLIEIEFDFESYSLNFGKLRTNDTATKSIFIQILDPEKTRITDITTSSPFVSVKRVEASDSADNRTRIELEVTLSPGLLSGRINETVTAHSSLESKSKATLRLTGSIVGDVEVIPEMLRFVVKESQSASNQNISQLLNITNNSENKLLRILGVRDPDDRLQLNVKTVEEGQKFELTATLKPDTLSTLGTQTGTIVITTNNQEQKEITVRYNVMRRK